MVCDAHLCHSDGVLGGAPGVVLRREFADELLEPGRQRRGRVRRRRRRRRRRPGHGSRSPLYNALQTLVGPPLLPVTLKS